MTDELLEKAQSKKKQIYILKKNIDIVETMLTGLNNDYADIKVCYKGYENDIGVTIHYSDFPELHDALKKAQRRLWSELRKAKDEFAEL